LDSLNLGVHRGDDRANVEENFRILGDALGFSVTELVLSNQVHGNAVRVVTRADARGIDNRDYPECDALITRDPGTALLVFTADCTPILLWDPVTGAVGAVHAGWRGTVSRIAVKTVLAMQEAYGCDPKNIHAAIGPNIGGCCFETGEEVPAALAESYGQEVLSLIRQGANNKYFPDLKAINALGLRRLGVAAIDLSAECTKCSPDRYWSHRVHGQSRGSQGAIIVCKGVTE
jgi:YfiH family protein